MDPYQSVRVQMEPDEPFLVHLGGKGGKKKTVARGQTLEMMQYFLCPPCLLKTASGVSLPLFLCIGSQPWYGICPPLYFCSIFFNPGD